MDEQTQDVARLALDLTRRRNEWFDKVERIEAEKKGRGAFYERGVAYGLSVALNALEAEPSGVS